MPITAARDITSPSAYVLFYVRRDVRNAHVSEVHTYSSPAVNYCSDAMSEGENREEVASDTHQSESNAVSHCDISAPEDSDRFNRQQLDQCILS